MMRQVKACGVFVMRTHPQVSFLLMQKPNRFDLPKGHMEAGESEWECAMRELREETGIEASAIEIDKKFRFIDTYSASYERFGKEVVEKTVVIFLGWLKQDVTIKLSEHSGFQWVDWNPPHKIQNKTIDPLLKSLEDYLSKNDIR